MGFGGVSAQSLTDRIEDGGCTAVITADGGWRRGSVLELKPQVDEAVEGLYACLSRTLLRSPALSLDILMTIGCLCV